MICSSLSVVAYRRGLTCKNQEKVSISTTWKSKFEWHGVIVWHIWDQKIQIFGEKHQNFEFSSFSVQSCPRTDTVKLWPNDNLCQSVSFFVQSCPRIASILNRQQSPISGENTTDWKFLSFTAQSWPRIDRIENRQQNSVPGEIMIKWLSPPICVQSC